MNSNEKCFQQKFEQCSKYLGVQPTNIISLKYREQRDTNFYVELLRHLQNIKSLTITDLGKTLNGQAYLLSYGDQKIVLVEHESGLEILYIIGSIASIISFILQISSKIYNRERHFKPFPPYIDDVEVRYFDDTGKFIEEHKNNYLPYEIYLPPQLDNTEIELLKKRVTNLENKMNKFAKKPVKKK